MIIRHAPNTRVSARGYARHVNEFRNCVYRWRQKTLRVLWKILVLHYISILESIKNNIIKISNIIKDSLFESQQIEL